ncbi:cupin domain-containing protein [Rhizobium ruizarguesonis]|uniref:cupin domain-containing protein n=1 Tax=Rhizobium ruizarguesonis TaxID=2081791 RepID=UPI0013EF4B9B|nr:cupin domain-containing protein [Rhizobium ruizarguesonis]
MSETKFENQPGWIDVFGPKVKPLTVADDEHSGYAVLLGVLDPGVVIPLHSHNDRETFYVLEGAIEGYSRDSWHPLGAGDVFDVPANTTHAWRNVSARQAKMLVVTTTRMGEFLQAIGRPATERTPPTPVDIGTFLTTAERYGYWLAPSPDNEAVGIFVE